MNTLRKASAALILSFHALYAWSSPNISGITQSGSSSYSVTGEFFGPSAKVELYESFEHEQGSNGTPISTQNAVRGEWGQEYPQYMPLYDSFARSGRFSMLGWNNDINYTRQIKLNFPSPIQTVFISYWVAIPPGHSFPGNDNLVGGFSTDSSWKFNWLYDEGRGGEDSDICIPTHVGSGISHIGGNDLLLAHTPKMENWWSWGNWVKITTFLEANPQNPTSDGSYEFTTWSREFGEYKQQEDIPVFDDDGPSVKEYNHLTFPGWLRGFPDNNGRPLYDDIYVASGPNALARIEVTNNVDYSLSDQFAIQNVTSWTDTEITFEWIEGDLSLDSDKFIHIFHADGSHSSAPFLVQKSVPKPPTLRVN